MDHDLSPPWTSLTIVKALRFGLFIVPPEQCTIERNKAFQMCTNRPTFHRQSWIPDTPKGDQVVFIPTARAENCPAPAIIEEQKLSFNPCIISLMFM